MNHKYILKMFILFFIILMTILLINSLVSNFNEDKQSIEGFNNKNPLVTDSSKAFCDSNKGAQQEKACNALTEYNCNLTSCCIWTRDKKCKAGNASGPLFNTDSNGKTIQLPYYFFQNKCYGPTC